MYKIKVILADDHSVLRTGLKLLLNNEPDFKVVGEASDGDTALELLTTLSADVLILDLSMPNMGGLECIKEIKSRKLSTKILVLSMFEDENYIKEAMQSGALGYVEKHAVDTELFDAVRVVAKGKRYLSPKNSQLLLNSFLTGRETETPATDPYTLLSSREREVLKLIVRGYSMTQIGDCLCISVKTVDTYKTRMMEKLNCTQKSQLVEYALKHGLLPVQS
ncbi:response regulator transcription factor [Propionispora vibrioides]|jgi:two-component system response regulator NreC|uniref:DNA-binding response regulator, NarL/FixJ family, contains REC and HTH domains n=1 Tax=Propionispora vibrioides TaxID=112903 RepID=A0A1H8Y5W8_9FIRM|nr:response regulator transcription factor [Propionispora vibrioides]SEP47680.1 DNA-binding response regulator, NarL/FixJ family, contains REC and HTH domains [Propionispora vibrioides]